MPSRGLGRSVSWRAGRTPRCSCWCNTCLLYTSSSAKLAQKRIDKLEKAGIRCKLTGYNGGYIRFIGDTPEAEALLAVSYTHLDVYKRQVLAVIRRYITSQNTVPRKEVALVKTSYGFKLKPYAPRLLDKVPNKAASINDLVLERRCV